MKRKPKAKIKERHPRNLLQRGSTWYVRAIVNGVQVFQSLHVSTLEEAIEKRDALLANIQTRATEKQMLQNVKRQLAGIEAEEEEERKATNKGIKLKNAFDLFLKDPNRRNCKSRQMENHKTHWEHFLKWMAENHKDVIYCRQVTTQIIKEWATFKYSTANSINTYNRHLSTIHYVFQIICENDEEMKNPTLSTHSKQAYDLQGKQPFTEEELQKIFKFPDEEFCRLCAIGLYTTLRLSSARLLKWGQYDGEYLEAIHDKTGADASLRVPENLKYWLDRVPKEERKGFISPTFANKNRPSNASQLFQSYLHKLGIQTQIVIQGLNGKTRTVCIKGFHSFRHFAITKALQNGASNSQVLRLAGHSSTRMQERYTHFGANDAGEASSKIGRYW